VQPPTPNDPTTPDGLTRVEATIEGAGVPAPPPPRRGRRVAVIAVAAVVGLAGVAAAASFMALRGSSETITTKLPADTDVVVTAYLDPAAWLKVNLFRLTSSFPSLGGESEVTGRAGDWVDSMLTQTGLTHDDLGWVGSQVALAIDVRPDAAPAIALLLDTTDETAAEVSLRALRDGPMFQGVSWSQEDHGGVRAWASHAGDVYTAIVDGTVVITNDAGTLDGIVAASSGGVPALAEDQDFVDTMAGLPQGRLGLVYVAPDDLLAVLDRIEGPGLSDIGTAAGVDPHAIRGIGMTLSAESDSMAIDTEVMFDPARLSPEQIDALGAEDHANALLTTVPADALGFLGVEHLDAGLDTALADLPSDQRAALDQSGVEPAISSLTGDLAAEVSMPAGASTPAGAVMMGTDDEEAMAAALEIAARALEPSTRILPYSPPPGYGVDSPSSTLGAEPQTWKTVDHDGVTVTYLPGDGGGTGIAPAYAVFDGIALFASSQEEAFRVIDAAHGAPNAMGADRPVSALAAVPGSEDVMYLDLAGIVGAVADTGLMDPGIRDDLRALQTLVAGSQSDTEHQHARLVLRIG